MACGSKLCNRLLASGPEMTHKYKFGLFVELRRSSVALRSLLTGAEVSRFDDLPDSLMSHPVHSVTCITTSALILTFNRVCPAQHKCWEILLARNGGECLAKRLRGMGTVQKSGGQLFFSATSRKYCASEVATFYVASMNRLLGASDFMAKACPYYTGYMHLASFLLKWSIILSRREILYCHIKIFRWK